jgi:hypothetical protein
VFFDPDEGVIVFLLFDSPHVFVKIVVDVFVAVAGVKGFEEELVVILSRKLLKCCLELHLFLTLFLLLTDSIQIGTQFALRLRVA